MKFVSAIALVLATMASSVLGQASIEDFPTYVLPGQVFSVSGVCGAGDTSVDVTFIWTANTNVQVATTTCAIGTLAYTVTVAAPLDFISPDTVSVVADSGEGEPGNTVTILAETLTIISPNPGSAVMAGATVPVTVNAFTGSSTPLTAGSFSFTWSYGGVTSSPIVMAIGTSSTLLTNSFTVPSNANGAIRIVLTDSTNADDVADNTIVWYIFAEQATVTPTLPIVTTVTAAAAVPAYGCGFSNGCSSPCASPRSSRCSRNSRRSNNCRLYEAEAAQHVQEFIAV